MSHEEWTSTGIQAILFVGKGLLFLYLFIGIVCVLAGHTPEWFTEELSIFWWGMLLFAPLYEVLRRYKKS